MKRAEMVLKGTERLVETENAIGKAFCEAARLAGDLEDMRIASGLSAVIGQEALSEVARAVALLTEARGAMVSAHGRLDEVKIRIGCRTVATGNGTDKGDTDDPVGPIRPLGRLRQVV